MSFCSLSMFFYLNIGLFLCLWVCLFSCFPAPVIIFAPVVKCIYRYRKFWFCNTIFIFSNHHPSFFFAFSSVHRGRIKDIELEWYSLPLPILSMGKPFKVSKVSILLFLFRKGNLLFLSVLSSPFHWPRLTSSLISRHLIMMARRQGMRALLVDVIWAILYLIVSLTIDESRR